MPSTILTENFSLLWPPGSKSDLGVVRSYLAPVAASDLGMQNLINIFTTNNEHQKEIWKVLNTLCQDLSVIRYRQEVLEDLLCHTQLVDLLEALLPTIDALGRQSHRVVQDMTTLHEFTWRMGELQSIVDCIHYLGEVFQEIGGSLSSQGLCLLRDQIAEIQADPDFQDLVEKLPKLLAELRTCASVTIGINLDQFLRPVEATLLAVNEERFTSQSMLSRIFGRKVNEREGLVALHTVPKREVEGPYALPIDPELGRAVDPMMVPLFEDLSRIIEKITRPITKEVKRYTNINGRMFVNLRTDLIFYLGAVRYVTGMRRHGLPVCMPDIVSLEERLCQVDEAYNVHLVSLLSGGDPERDLNAAVVLNNIEFGPEGRVLILTGPNRGGKTAYMQGVGLIQVLSQAGLYVPGSRARISPVDNIYTHFPTEEKPGTDTGRFGAEAKRLGEIFQQVTRYSLVLLNESLSSTSTGESLYIARDLVCIIRRYGGRAIYSTHLHELAENVDELNRSTPGESKIISIVSSPVKDNHPPGADIHRTFKIEAREPMGRSYAREIATKYGISYDQLENLLIERGVFGNNS